MEIRMLQAQHQTSVLDIMAKHEFQFPSFIREQYPSRWRSFLKEKEKSKSCYLVMIDGDENVIGHAGYILREATNLFEIVGVATRTDQVRKGIGSSLITTICKKVGELGYKEIVLHTLDHEQNQAALAFYERMGFQRINLEMDYYFAGYHRLTLLKSL